MAAVALATAAWSEVDRIRCEARAADVARRLAQIEAAVNGRAASGLAAPPTRMTAHGAALLVGVDAFGAVTTAHEDVEERP